LRTAFDTPIESADTTVTARATLRGSSPQAQQPTGLRISGPYKSTEEGQLPSVDWQVQASQGPGSFAARLVTVPDNAFVFFQNTPYEVGRDRLNQILQAGERRPLGTLLLAMARQRGLSEFGVEPSAWVVAPQRRGETEVAGEDTTQISGRLDVARMLRDLNRVEQEQARRSPQAGPPQSQITEDQITQIVRAIQQPSLDVFVGDDDTVRRMVLRAPFNVPANLRRSGVDGGNLDLTTELADVGGDQEINPPPNAKPLEELVQQFGLPPGAVPPGGGAPGGAPPGGGR
jgi:hypothetical protein